VKILFLTLVFSPDGVSTSILMTELALELKALGHSVTVLTTTPHYNLDPEARSRQPLKRCRGGFFYRSNCQGIPVYHASMPMKGSRVGARLIDYARFHAISTAVGVFIAGGYDLILTPSPPLTIGLSAWLMGLARRVPFIYNVQEIYPDVAVSLGVLRNRHLITAMERLECFIYSRARSVVVISEWFRRRLLAKGVPPEKLIVIPNFVDTKFMQPGERHNSFSATHGLDNQFVVLYAGNIGLTQGFETILAAARKLTHIQDLHFLVVGDGARRVWLKEQLAQNNISNVILLPYQPRSVVPQIYASSDLCLVPLKRGTAQETFPSKIYTIMAASRPVIVSADSESELTWVVEKADCGWTVPPDDPDALAASIEHIYHRRADLQHIGRNGREYVIAHHSRRPVALQYHKLFQQIADDRTTITNRS
jgi:colanic acid biosynthesis glycosyl transferase WcaI